MGWRAIMDHSVAASAVALVAAVGTGTAAQFDVVDTSGVRWIHHGLFAAVVGTYLLANAAMLAGRRPGRPWALGGLVALAVLPRTRGGTPGHAAAAGVASACHVVAHVRRG